MKTLKIKNVLEEMYYIRYSSHTCIKQPGAKTVQFDYVWTITEVLYSNNSEKKKHC